MNQSNNPLSDKHAQNVGADELATNTSRAETSRVESAVYSLPMAAREQGSQQVAFAASMSASDAQARPAESGGAKGLEPTRYGDWEHNGRCTDF